MSDNIGNMSTVVSADTSGVTAGFNQAIGASHSFATVVQQDLQQLNANATVSTQKIDELSAAFGRMLDKMERSSQRGNGGRYFEEFERMEAHLASVRAGFSAITIPESLKGDLAYVNSLLSRIDSLRPTITAQAVATGVTSGNLLPGAAQPLPPRTEFTNDYMRYQQFQNAMGTQGYQAVQLHDLDMSNVKRIRSEAEDIEYQRYQNALRNGGQMGPDYSGIRMYQSDPDLGQMIRTSEQQQRYKEEDAQFAADAEKRRMRAAIENAGNMGPDYSGIHLYQSDPDLGRLIQDQERKTQAQADREYRLNRAREMDVSGDRFYRDQVRDSRNESNDWAKRNQAPAPIGPQVYQLNTSNSLDLRYAAIQREEQLRANIAEQENLRLEDRKRREAELRQRMGDRQGPSYVPDSYGPFISQDQLARNSRGQRGIGGVEDYERNGRRAFIGQQMAFGIDDMTQQFMWSNSTAGGVAAAARAGGNNMTAALGATGMPAGPMIGAMLGVQGLAMATSMWFKYVEETERARVSTEKLEKAIGDVHSRVSKEVTFKYKLEDGSSKELREDATKAERDKELRDKGKLGLAAEEMSRALAREEELKEKREAARKKEVPVMDPMTGMVTMMPGDSVEIDKIDKELKVIEEKKKAFAADSEEYYRESARYEEEKVKREEMIKRREKEEKRKEERDRRSKLEIDQFNKDIADEEKYTGRKLTGEEYKARYEEFKQSRPDLNFNDENKQVEGNARQQDRDKASNRYEQGMRRYEDERKFEQDMRLRMNPMGDIERRYEDRLKEINEKFGELLPEERGRLRTKARQERDLDVFQKEREIGDSLRKGYRPMDGITQGSTDEAVLNARLTSQVDTEGRDLQKEMNRLLGQINENTKPARRPEPPVTSLPPA